MYVHSIYLDLDNVDKKFKNILIWALSSLLLFFPQVKYREKYINSLGTWKSIPDRPEFFFSRIVNDNVSNVSTVDLHCKIMLSVFNYLPTVL